MLPARFVPEGGTFHKRERGRKSVRILTSVWSLGGRNRTDEFFSFDGFGKTINHVPCASGDNITNSSAIVPRSGIDSLMSEVPALQPVPLVSEPLLKSVLLKCWGLHQSLHNHRRMLMASTPPEVFWS